MKSTEKKILIGVNDSINSKIASSYVKDFLGGEAGDCEVVLLHIIPRAKSEEEEKLRGIHEEDKLRIMEGILLEIKNDFVNSGLSPDAVKIEIDKGRHDTVAEGILDDLPKENVPVPEGQVPDGYVSMEDVKQMIADAVKVTKAVDDDSDGELEL